MKNIINFTPVDETPGSTDEYRTWFHTELPGSPGRGDVIVIMKNPSWLDAGNVGLTEARKMATECGFSNLHVGNLFGRRARRPRGLNSLRYEDAVTDNNDGLLTVMAGDIDLVVAAWGNANGLSTAWYRRRV